MAVNNSVSNTDDTNNNYIKRGNLVVRVDEDSDDNLNALFDIILNPQVYKQPKQLPFRMRKLPNSFFNPPSSSVNSNTSGSKLPAVHSRENSADSAFDSGCSSVAASFGNDGSGFIHNTSAVVDPALHVIHTRAHSSPASLQQSYVNVKKISNENSNTLERLLQQQQQQSHPGASSLLKPKVCHSKQRSYDVISTIQLKDKFGDLPHGWEQARTTTGQIYYLKYVFKNISFFVFVALYIVFKFWEIFKNYLFARAIYTICNKF